MGKCRSTDRFYTAWNSNLGKTVTVNKRLVLDFSNTLGNLEFLNVIHVDIYVVITLIVRNQRVYHEIPNQPDYYKRYQYANGKSDYPLIALFLPVEYGGEKTMAQLTADEKDAISHRGKSVRLLAKQIEEGNV